MPRYKHIWYHTCPECKKEIPCTNQKSKNDKCECEYFVIDNDKKIVFCSEACCLEFKVFGD